MMIKQRIVQLKNQFKAYDIDGYIIPSTDEYLSEYTPQFAKRLEYVTGFNGSNGICIIFHDYGLFFTDGRYLEQSKKQLDLKFFQIFDIRDIVDFPFEKYIQNHNKIGYDPKLFTKQTLKVFEYLHLKSISTNLIDEIWQEQPSRPNSKVYLYSEEFAGIGYSDKINICKKAITDNSAIALVITSSDSICWLLNIRASDIGFSPLMLGYVAIFMDRIYLFTNVSRIDDQVKKLRADVEFLPENQFKEFLKNIDGKVLIDENSASISVVEAIKNKQHLPDPCKYLKACKNDVEIKHTIEGHIKDAVALCEFFASLKIDNLDDLTEYDLGLKLTALRAKQKNYIMDSFPAICGFKENGAIIHYRALEQTAKKIQGNGLLLIDSGGQYLGATTDITRTLIIGEPTSEQKDCYTKVLRGHLNLSMIKFPSGVTGANLEVLARQFLWLSNLDYPHSTGHGVGSYLSVHEGPQGISLKNNVPLKPGMILSNEPGFYSVGEFGIRIENLMYVRVADSSNFLQFENLSLVPYERALINLNMLNSSEVEYLEQYYKKIYESIYHLLSGSAKNWLDSQMRL
jgi:Xaa-Pro aminopeptidase